MFLVSHLLPGTTTHHRTLMYRLWRIPRYSKYRSQKKGTTTSYPRSSYHRLHRWNRHPINWDRKTKISHKWRPKCTNPETKMARPDSNPATSSIATSVSKRLIVTMKVRLYSWHHRSESRRRGRGVREMLWGIRVQALAKEGGALKGFWERTDSIIKIRRICRCRGGGMPRARRAVKMTRAHNCNYSKLTLHLMTKSQISNTCQMLTRRTSLIKYWSIPLLIALAWESRR